MLLNNLTYLIRWTICGLDLLEIREIMTTIEKSVKFKVKIIFENKSCIQAILLGLKDRTVYFSKRQVKINRSSYQHAELTYPLRLARIDKINPRVLR